VHGLCCFYTPGHNKYDPEYSIKELRPTYVEGFFSWSEQDVTKWAEAEYANVDFEGVPLLLLKGSRDVRWEDVQAPPEAAE